MRLIIIDDFSTIIKVETALAEMSAMEQVKELIRLVNLVELDNKEIFHFCLGKLKNLSEDMIASNLSSLMELEHSRKQSIRDLASELLNRLSVVHLANNFHELINSMHSCVVLERFQAELLLMKIDGSLLVDKFEELRELSEHNSCDIRRISRNLIPKVVRALPIQKKVTLLDYAFELQNSAYPSMQNVGILLLLEIVATWPKDDKRLVNKLTFFKDCTAMANYEISYLAARLAFELYKNVSYSQLVEDIDYLTSFNNCGEKEIRREYRHLALSILSFMDEKCLPKFGKFFLQCLEGKSKEDRKIAGRLLAQISPDDLPVEDLVNCQSSGLFRVRWVGRRLAGRVSQKCLVKHVDFFLSAQHSQVRGVRELAHKLAVSILFQNLGDKRDIAASRLESTNMFEANLARYLIRQR